MPPITLPNLPKLSRPAPPKPENCLNCGFAVEHNFCPMCGQENTPSRVAFGALVRDGWDDLVKVDAKLLKTLVPLLFKPGFLTQEYVAGRRMRYLSPFKMYLVISAIFFVLVSWRGGAQIDRVSDNLSSNITASQSRGQGPSAPTPPGASRRQGQQQKRAPNGSGSPNREAAAKGKAASSPPTGAAAPVGDDRPFKDGRIQLDGGDSINLSGLPLTVEEYRREQDALAPAKRHTTAKRFIVERAIRLNRPGIQKEVLAALLDNIPNMMFFLVPLFALNLKLLYLRSGKLYVEHLVYALHLHSFFFLLAALDVAVNDRRLLQALLAVFVVYGFVALRRFYGQSIGKTLFKGSLLIFGYLWLLAFGVLATFLATLALV